MMRYKSRPGVVLTQIHGEYLLVSSRSLRELCPFVTSLNESSAFLWKQLQNGASEEELLRAVAEEYEVEEPEALRGVIRSFLEQMQAMHYLLEEG